jgi:hypothetical protein
MELLVTLTIPSHPEAKSEGVNVSFEGSMANGTGRLVVQTGICGTRLRGGGNEVFCHYSCPIEPQINKKRGHHQLNCQDFKDGPITASSGRSSDNCVAILRCRGIPEGSEK